MSVACHYCGAVGLAEGRARDCGVCAMVDSELERFETAHERRAARVHWARAEACLGRQSWTRTASCQ